MPIVNRIPVIVQIAVGVQRDNYFGEFGSGNEAQ